ncbi:WPP domain-associated protein [Quillaja saponaria]|uniref:WPP domain-associated protein n=1 Tax=Quillaja saponaria TaxID=32244 RepID=A0AAD7M369_QUISA|nr:WPP domain-associated protein [Quillaja saponaria]
MSMKMSVKKQEFLAESFISMDGSKQISNHAKENESLGDNILEDFDAYWEDISDRLTISRMVSDSVIKGMVNAVEQEAAERIAQKDLEVAGLKEMLHIYYVGADTVEEHDTGTQSLSTLRIAAKKQFKNLKNEIDRMKGFSSIRRISSGSELIGLGGILQEKVPERSIYVDNILESLKYTLDSFYKRVEVMTKFPEESLFEWQQEQEFRAEIEGMVITNCIQSMQEEFEQKLWDENAKIYGAKSVNWDDNVKEISSLRKELESVSKLLSVSEAGQLISHGSLECDEDWCSNKRTEHLHWKLSTNHFSLPTPHSEKNGKLDKSNVGVPENLDPAPVRNMAKDDLITYYNSEMNKMRINHECQVQEITEDNFRLRRELMKERSSSSPFKKDKEFELLRKKIPDIILKLDEILIREEKVHPFSEKIESHGWKDRLESILSENHRLRFMLADKKKEVETLSSQLSDAKEKLSQKHLTEKKLLKMTQNLECDIQDAHAEISVFQDVYKCLLTEIMGEVRCISEASDMKCTFMEEIYEIILKEAAHNVQSTSRFELSDVDMESIAIQDVSLVIFREALMDAVDKLGILNMKCINGSQNRVTLEKEAFENREALKLEVAEKESIKREMKLLTTVVEEKKKLATEAADELEKYKREMELAFEELNSLRDQTIQQQNLIVKSSKNSDVTKGNLVEALKKIEQYKMDLYELHQNLELARKELREADEQRRILRTLIEENQNALALFEAKEIESRKHMESIMFLDRGLSKAICDFECRVDKDISRNSLRLRNMTSEFHCLINKANILRKTESAYKQRLERRCSDLEKAEAEVDLLGDEVDHLLSLLEKIYIALDHYSPILRHYPGITEILQLVRRELSGDSTKSV